MTRLRRWVARQIAHALNVVLGGGRFGILGVVLAFLVVAGLIVLIVLSVRATNSNPIRSGHVVGGRRRPPEDWLAEAAACEARGDWRGALRSRYRALVAGLAARGVVEEIAGRTTGEYRQAVVVALPAVAPDFSSATDMFEQAWYGDRPADAGEAARFRAVADRVMAGSR